MCALNKIFVNRIGDGVIEYFCGCRIGTDFRRRCFPLMVNSSSPKQSSKMSTRDFQIRQLNAGFVLDGVWKLFADAESGDIGTDLDWPDVWRFLCAFDLVSDFPLDTKPPIPILCVAQNMISRGLPTKAPYSMEQSYAEEYPFYRLKEDKVGALSADLMTSPELASALRNALFKTYPNFNKSGMAETFPVLGNTENGWQSISGGEEAFLDRLPSELGEGFGFVVGMLEPQCSISSIIDFPGKRAQIFSKMARMLLDRKLEDKKGDFYDQRVDFSLQLPAANDYQGEDSAVIEIDDLTHEDPSKARLDQIRDDLLRELGWHDTLRFPASPDQKENMKGYKASLQQLKAFLNHPYITAVKDSLESEGKSSVYSVPALDIMWGPLFTARLMASLVQAIQAGALDLAAEKWDIQVIEDGGLGWAGRAFSETVKFLSDLFTVEGVGRRMPKIHLSVSETDGVEEIARTDLLSTPDGTFEELIQSDAPEGNTYDLVLDVSLWQTRIGGFLKSSRKVSSRHRMWLRRSFSPVSEPYVECAPAILYPGLFVEGTKGEDGLPERTAGGDDRVEALKRLINTLFRKKDFMAKQLEILDLALQQRNVIALLPTGGGKSLIFQLAGILQPTITTVVQPIRSLMADQIQNLEASLWGNCSYVNSDLGVEEKQVRLREYSKGRYLLFYLAPERFYIPEFRASLKRMSSEYGKHCLYCVIDEAHCVSEWGHDFRPLYLRLGKNAQELLPTFSGQKIVLLALTGTASYDVLADIQRELSIEDRLAVKTPDSFTRPELKFRVVHIPQKGRTRKDRSLVRKGKLSETLRELPSSFGYGDRFEDAFSSKGEKTRAGIIFCPHAKGGFGVNSSPYDTGLCDHLQRSFPEIAGSIAHFTGQDGSDSNQVNQERFKANRASIMVATKAFGMGIDKPNVRFTVHACMPSSVEAFYQEAGRAGRDKENAFCTILYNEQDEEIQSFFVDNSFPSETQELGRGLHVLEDDLVFFNRALEEIRKDLEVELGVFLNLTHTEKCLHVKSWEGDKRRYRLYGYIFFDEQLRVSPGTGPSDFPENESRHLLENIKERIITGMKSTGEDDPRVFLDEYKIASVQKSLAKIIDQGDESDLENPVMMNFEGNAASLFALKVRQVWSRRSKAKSATLKEVEEIRKIMNEAKEESEKARRRSGEDSLDVFIECVTKGLEAHPKRFAHGKDFDNELLIKVFNGMQTESDTFKTINRLSILGLLKDFEVNYGGRFFRLFLEPGFSPKKCQSSLEVYIRRYESQDYLNTLDLEEIGIFSRPSAAVKVGLGKLIRFTYEKIKVKRQAQLDFMRNACERGENPEIFEKEIYTYFHAKYAEDLKRDFCSPDKAGGFAEIFYWLDERIREDETGAYVDNVSHLKGSCSRLIPDFPHVPELYLLRGFSVLTNAAMPVGDGFKDLFEGWRGLLTTRAMPRERAKLMMESLVDRILKDRPEKQFEKKLRNFLEIFELERQKAVTGKFLKEIRSINDSFWR